MANRLKGKVVVATEQLCTSGSMVLSRLRDPRNKKPRSGRRKYGASKALCDFCPSKPKCCPNTNTRYITREEHEDARDITRLKNRVMPPEVSMHDFRRSLRSNIAGRWDEDLCEVLLAHARPSITGVYNKSARLTDRLDALTWWNDQVMPPASDAE